MAKFEDLKNKVMSTVGQIIEKSADIYETAEEKAKYIAKTTKIKAEIAKDNSEIKKLYADLGSLYYCLNKDNPDEALAQLCSEIKDLSDKVEMKQRELDALAAQAAEKDIVVDITDDTEETPEGEETDDTTAENE